MDFKSYFGGSVPKLWEQLRPHYAFRISPLRSNLHPAMNLGLRITLVILGMAVLCILFAASAYGPRKKNARPLPTSTPWTIQSWQWGTITVEHDGRMYDATRNPSTSVTVPPGYTLASPKYDFPFSPNCDLPTRFVGKTVQNRNLS